MLSLVRPVTHTRIHTPLHATFALWHHPSSCYSSPPSISKSLQLHSSGVTIQAPYKGADQNEDAFGLVSSIAQTKGDATERIHLCEWSSIPGEDGADSALRSTLDSLGQPSGAEAIDTLEAIASTAADGRFTPELSAHQHIYCHGVDAAFSPVRKHYWRSRENVIGHPRSDTAAASVAFDFAAVADGVGGWRSQNVNSGVYARRLMRQFLKGNPSLGPGVASIDAKGDWMRKWVQAGVDAVHAEKVLGSSTACFAFLPRMAHASNANESPAQKLHVLNLGDSGLVWIRNQSVIYRTPILEHAFNFPVQLGLQSDDSAHDALAHSDVAQEGDILVLGTDGFFDNLFEDDIIATIAQMARDPKQYTPEKIAENLAANALFNSLDPNYSSPFYEEASRRGYSVTIGGKEDDITVVVSFVTSGQS